MSLIGKWGCQRGDSYEGQYETEMAAAQGYVARNLPSEGDEFRVAQFSAPPAAEGFVDGHQLVEHSATQDDYQGDWAEGWPDANQAQYEELTTEIRKVYGDWLDRQGLRPNWGHVDPQDVRVYRVVNGDVVPLHRLGTVALEGLRVSLNNKDDGLWLNLSCSDKCYSVNLSLTKNSMGPRLADTILGRYCDGVRGTGEVPLPIDEQSVLFKQCQELLQMVEGVRCADCNREYVPGIRNEACPASNHPATHMWRGPSFWTQQEQIKSLEEELNLQAAERVDLEGTEIVGYFARDRSGGYPGVCWSQPTLREDGSYGLDIHRIDWWSDPPIKPGESRAIILGRPIAQGALHQQPTQLAANEAGSLVLQTGQVLYQAAPVADAKFNSDHSRSRALHRVVRAMHDGECPRCHKLHNSAVMPCVAGRFRGHECPSCGFRISAAESKAALAEFAKYMDENLGEFEKWRSEQDRRYFTDADRRAEEPC